MMGQPAGPANDEVSDDVILEILDLTVHFAGRKGFFGAKKKGVTAVDGVSIQMKRGAVLGLVGESGSGKTTLGRAILGLAPITSGEVVYHSARGETFEVTKLNAPRKTQMRSSVRMVFQDPNSSLNPRFRTREIIGDPLRGHLNMAKAGIQKKVAELLTAVNLSPNVAGRYPHAFSGGQRQRIGVARALASDPEFVVCDEAVSALDVSVQAQIINLLKDLQSEKGLTYLFITHNLSVVGHISDYIAVMYLGVIVEYRSAADLFRKPLHPYTEGLIQALPIPDPNFRKLSRDRLVKGEMETTTGTPSGCRFHPRCRFAKDKCKVDRPGFRKMGDGWVACHFAEDLNLTGLSNFWEEREDAMVKK